MAADPSVAASLASLEAPVAPVAAAPPSKSMSAKEELAHQVAEEVLEKLKPLFEMNTQSLARVVAKLSALTAQVGIQGAQGAKSPVARAPRAGSTAKASSAGGGGDSGDGIHEDKVKNNMLYNRMMYIRDPEYRKIARQRVFQAKPEMTPEALEQMFNTDSTCAGKAVGSTERTSAEAKIIWKQYEKAQKEVVKAEFERWKTERATQGIAEPLAADQTDAVVGEVEPAAASTAMTSSDINALLGDSPF